MKKKDTNINEIYFPKEIDLKFAKVLFLRLEEYVKKIYTPNNIFYKMENGIIIEQ